MAQTDVIGWVRGAVGGALASARRLARRIRRDPRLRRAGRAAVARLPSAARDRIEARSAARRVRLAYDDVLVPEADLEARYAAALSHLRSAGPDDAIGDYLEFGVCHGTSMRCMHRALTGAGLRSVRMFGFDSFEGLPAEAADDDGGGVWRPGQFDSDEELTRSRLTGEGVDWSRTHLVKGWFSDTLTPELLAEHDMAGRASIVMVDCDMYLSAKQSLDFCARTLADEAVVFFDDWNSGGGLAARNLGEKRAFDEFLAEHPEFDATERPDLRYADNANVFVVTRRSQGRSGDDLAGGSAS